MSRPRGDEPLGSVDGPVVSRSRRAPEVSYRAFLMSRGAPRVHWASPEGLELSGVGAAAQIVSDGADRFARLKEETTHLFDEVVHEGPTATRPRLIGGFSFTDDHRAAPPWTGFRGASLVLPRIQLTSHGNDAWVTVHAVGPDATPREVEDTLDKVVTRLEDLPSMRSAGDPPGVKHTERSPGRVGWRSQVEAALEKIDAGTLRKVVLAQRLQVELEASIAVPDVLERVRRSYEDCFRFLIEPPGNATFFGAPPERLLRRKGRAVETEALAGSVRRGDTPEEDAELADRLREDEKLRIEQELVADTIEDALRPLGEVSVGQRGVRRLENIQHLHTPIQATLNADTHVLELVQALHPTPAVGGLPPDEALTTIRETEAFDRGWYAAPVGWVDASGDGEFAVAIRSGVAGDRRVSLFAGNGIVAEANPDEEWEELQQKYRPILDELQ